MEPIPRDSRALFFSKPSKVLSFVLRLFELDWYIIFAGNCILFIREYWMIAALTQGGARAGQAGGQAAPQPELRHHLENQQQPMLRQRFSMLFKIALLMFLMEVRWHWYAP